MLNTCSEPKNQLCFPRNIESRKEVLTKDETSDGCAKSCLPNTFITVSPHFAWPVVTIIIFLYLKKDVLKLLDLLCSIAMDADSISIKGFDIKRRLRKVSEKVEEEGILSHISGEFRFDQSNQYLRYEHLKYIPHTKIEHIYQLVDLAPRSAIMEIWIDLEKVIRNKLKNTSKSQTSNLYKSLLEDRIINSTQFEILNELKKIRNEVAHTKITITTKEAANFVNSTLKLISLIEKNQTD